MSAHRRRLLAAIDVALDQARMGPPHGDDEITRSACRVATNVALEVQDDLGLPLWVGVVLDACEHFPDSIGVVTLLEHARAGIPTTLRMVPGGAR